MSLLGTYPAVTTKGPIFWHNAAFFCGTLPVSPSSCLKTSDSRDGYHDDCRAFLKDKVEAAQFLQHQLHMQSWDMRALQIGRVPTVGDLIRD